jgi:ferredoxin
VHVTIEQDRCQGHGRCYTVAAELFDSDDLGNGVVRGDGTVPDGAERAAALAVANCPEGAVGVEES